MSKKNMIELPTSGYLYIIGDTKVELYINIDKQLNLAGTSIQILQ